LERVGATPESIRAEVKITLVAVFIV